MSMDLMEHDLQAHDKGLEPFNTNGPLSPELLRKIDAYWRAANYLSVGQIYLYDNPLLKRPLTLADVKHMLARADA
jgi:xylulose-5-phosphate/fructose-6-phosphate phosphoketolase